jgi:hypothetical protein
MASQTTGTQGFSESAGLEALRGLLRHARNMMLLWLAFGVVVGACITPPGGGWIGLVSYALAGMIMLPPVGLLFGMIGARWRESLICGVLGLLLGALAGLAGGQVGIASAFGLIFGGFVGATFLAFFYRLPRLLLSRFSLPS